MSLAYLELITERLIIEENPGVVVLSIPLIFELAHTLHQTYQLGVPHQTDQSGSRFGRFVSENRNRFPQIRTSSLRVSVIGMLFKPSHRTRCVLLRACLRNRTEHLVRVRLWFLHCDVDDVTSPGTRRWNHPEQHGEEEAYKNSKLTFGHCVPYGGREISDGRPSRGCG